MDTTDRRRKLPKPLRVANLIYKIIMAILAGLSFVFATFSELDPIYYQVVSVFSSAFPIIWSQILDASKTYVSEQTPRTNSPSDSTTIPAE